MSEECKKCTYSKECPDMVEHNSVYCRCHKRIPKNKVMSYEELELKVNHLESIWNELKNSLYSVFDYDKNVFSENYLECVRDVLDKMRELDEMYVGAKKGICSRDIRTGKLSRSIITIK